jgi:hypothetical protein
MHIDQGILSALAPNTHISYVILHDVLDEVRDVLGTGINTVGAYRRKDIKIRFQTSK